MQNIRFHGLAIILTFFCGLLFTKNLSINVQSSYSEVAFENEKSDKPNFKISKSLVLYILVDFPYPVYSNNRFKISRHCDVKDNAFVQKLLAPNYTSLPPPLHT